MNKTEPFGVLIRLLLRLAEYGFQIKYKKGSENAQADALFRLLSGSPIEPNDPDDIPAFAMETESTQNSDTEYAYPEEDFIEDDYNQIDPLLDAEPEKPLDLRFTHITFEELISAQLHDPFCSKIH